MDNAGCFTLGDFTLTAPKTYVPATGAHLEGLIDMLSCGVELYLKYGSGGSPGGIAYLQTSLDQADEGGVVGGSWVDIAAVSFDTISKTWMFNFSALTPKTTPVLPTNGSLTPDTAIDGILGDRLRLLIVSDGTYATNTVFGGRIVAR